MFSNAVTLLIFVKISEVILEHCVVCADFIDEDNQFQYRYKGD